LTPTISPTPTANQRNSGTQRLMDCEVSVHSWSY
jgi:hypothetical protein